jgi:putative addiction module component (TIGR02574 family)
MMPRDRIILEAFALSPADRLDVIEQLWLSVAAAPDELELTDAQRHELDRRLADAEANPGDGIPWEHINGLFH